MTPLVRPFGHEQKLRATYQMPAVHSTLQPPGSIAWRNGSGCAQHLVPGAHAAGASWLTTCDNVGARRTDVVYREPLDTSYTDHKFPDLFAGSQVFFSK